MADTYLDDDVTDARRKATRNGVSRTATDLRTAEVTPFRFSPMAVGTLDAEAPGAQRLSGGHLGGSKTEGQVPERPHTDRSHGDLRLWRDRILESAGAGVLAIPIVAVGSSMLAGSQVSDGALSHVGLAAAALYFVIALIRARGGSDS